MNTVGDVLKTQGNLPEAVKSYSASLAIADEDGLFTCAGCERSVYVPSVSMN